MTQITDQLDNIRRRIARAAEAAGRAADDITLLAVSKQQPADAIEAAWRAGQRHFAENYLQEALQKMRALSHLDIQWHFIGRIQANKTRPIAEHFQWVHTIDRERIAVRLNEHRPDAAARLKVFVQINQGHEPQKGGAAEADAEALARLIAAQPRLELRGLMSIPPSGGERETRRYFERLRALRDDLIARGVGAESLSMGMSADFELAIACGSDFVRVGSAIFGPRPPR